MTTTLLSDVGGTNIRFSCFKDGVLTSIEYFKRSDFKDITAAIDMYLSLSHEDPDTMILGVAGLVEKNKVFLTNGNWEINASVLEAKYHQKKVFVVNDFVLQGYGVLTLEEDELLALGTGQIEQKEPCVVLGPGTGLGVCFLVFKQESGYEVISSEGGHITISALTPNQKKIIEMFSAIYENHISYERLVSGLGVCTLYDVVCHLNKKQDIEWAKETDLMKRAFETITRVEDKATSSYQKGRAEEIALLASKGDEEALLTFWYFFQFLGIFSADMALILKAKGGVFLVGGFLRDDFIKTLLEKSLFRFYFEKKGRFSSYLSKIPTFLVLKKEVSFAGLAYLAEKSD